MSVQPRLGEERLLTVKLLYLGHAIMREGGRGSHWDPRAASTPVLRHSSRVGCCAERAAGPDLGIRSATSSLGGPCRYSVSTFVTSCEALRRDGHWSRLSRAGRSDTFRRARKALSAPRISCGGFCVDCAATGPVDR